MRTLCLILTLGLFSGYGFGHPFKLEIDHKSNDTYWYYPLHFGSVELHPYAKGIFSEWIYVKMYLYRDAQKDGKQYFQALINHPDFHQEKGSYVFKFEFNKYDTHILPMLKEVFSDELDLEEKNTLTALGL